MEKTKKAGGTVFKLKMKNIKIIKNMFRLNETNLTIYKLYILSLNLKSLIVVVSSGQCLQPLC